MACNLLPLALALASPQAQPPRLRLRQRPLPKSSPLSPPTNSFPALRTRRGDLAVPKAGGPPSSTSLILAFVLPLSLFAGTVFASIRIADQLEDKFLEDLAMNKAVMEENEEGEGDYGEAAVFTDDDGTMVMEEEVAAAAAAAAATPRVRIRPRKEA